MCRLADVPFLPDVYAPRVESHNVGCGALCSFSRLHYLGEERLEKTAKCIIYQDFAHEYRWRLRSSEGATIAFSERGHHQKSGCAQELAQCALEYPDAFVRDATVRGFEKQLLSQWLASQAS